MMVTGLPSLEGLGVPFMVRATANITVCVNQPWHELSRTSLSAAENGTHRWMGEQRLAQLGSVAQ